MYLEDYGKYTKISYYYQTVDPDFPYRQVTKSSVIKIKGFKYTPYLILTISKLSDAPFRRKLRNLLDKFTGFDSKNKDIVKVTYIKNGEEQVHPLGLVLLESLFTIPIGIFFILIFIVLSPVLVPYIIWDEEKDGIKRYIRKIRL